jgi:CRP/FNR family transcriptional regulator, cyclic AMP receptor protein
MSFFDYPTDETASTKSPAAVSDSFLPDASPGEWSDLLRFASTRHLAAGETLISLGDADRSLHLVRDGSLEVLQPAKRGRWRRLRTVESGSVLGELAFFDGDERSAAVRALTPATVAQLSYDEFGDLASTRPDLALLVAMDLGRILANRLRRFEASSVTVS